MENNVCINSDLGNGSFVLFEDGSRGIVKSAYVYPFELHFWLSADKQQCSFDCKETQGIVRTLSMDEAEVVLSAVSEAGFLWDINEKAIKKAYKPIFEEGDKIVKKDSLSGLVHEIEEVMGDYYILKRGNIVPFDRQVDYKLVEKKVKYNFKPFDKVIYKRTLSNGKQFWCPSIFSCYAPYNAGIYLVGSNYVPVDDVIPYDGNEEKTGKFV